MIDRYQLTKEILDLVDHNPLTNVDIAPLIQKHSKNLELEKQRSLRVMILKILSELKENKEIEYVDGKIDISSTVAGEFVDNGGLIRSTYKRQSKICLLYTSPSPRDGLLSRMPSSA